MFEAVIFDMDGVLIDSQHLHYKSDIDALSKAGAKASLRDVTPYAGVAAFDRFSAYKKNFKINLSVEELLRLQVETLSIAFGRGELVPIDGIPELLEFLRARKKRTALASSSSNELIETVLTKTKLKNYFEIAISGEDVPSGKPSPDIFLRAAQMLGVLPASCAVIEDSPNGILAAKRAGMTCFAYRSAEAPPEGFWQADLTVGDYSKLYDRLA
ncbi:MAG: HAD family phosphatase [Defluviitaleaceae bacterium]|nr:HAD family phosphatase [Defluviitaleaceae bacterium]